MVACGYPTQTTEATLSVDDVVLTMAAETLAARALDLIAVEHDTTIEVVLPFNPDLDPARLGDYTCDYSDKTIPICPGVQTIPGEEYQ